ncbi:tripartite tricarboxylate transporter substrate binding protein [Paralcaligenes ginsengisoli]
MNWFHKLLLGIGIASAGIMSTASAATYPDKPIKLLVPFPAGGGTDIVARKLAQKLTADLKQTVYVENRGGASGNIGAAAVAHAPADGYTLMMTAAPFAIAPALFKGLSFHPVKDFTAITEIATVPLLIVTRNDSPLNTVADLLAAARKKGTDITYATFGVGSPPHLVGEKIQQLARIKMRQIPYKGGQAALSEILSGQISIGILDVVSMAPLVKSGRLKALAITGPIRAPELPNIPTLSEQGVHFDAVGWYGLFAPAGLPPAVTHTLNAAVNKVLATPDMRKLIVTSGSIPISPPTSASQWQATFNNDVQVWGQIAHDSGATVN